jgi:Ca-activated chloride channel homolog
MRFTAVRLGLFILLLCVASPAATLRSLVNEGNERYSGKEYEEALKVYRLAAEQSPDSHFAHFNLGAALYRTGEYTQAIGSFQHAAQMARENGDQPAEALSRYNLGNSFVKSSEADAQSNPREAIAALENGVESYRQALDLDPKLSDAEHNIALARKKMKELLDKMRNTPAGGDSQEGQEQVKQQVEDNLRKQKELADKRQELQQQQQQGKQDAQQQAQQQAQEQKDLEQQSRDIAKQLDKPQSSPQQQQAKKNLEQAAQQQQQASQQLGQKQLQQASGSQQAAQKSLEDALASLGGKPNQDQQPQQQQQPGASQQQSQPQQLQALEQSPQDILNEERANRRRRRMLMLGAQAKVDKDW